MADDTLIAGIDAGGTSFKLGVADRAGRLLAKAKIPTTGPAETIAEAVTALKAMATAQGGQLSALGVAAFGPVDVDAGSPRYGTILTTPKPGWSDFPLRRALAEGLGCAVSVDTDVNGALAAEMASGAATDARSAAYITVGTGIGAGIFAGGGFVGRPSHPEFGHIPIRRHPLDTGFAGVCPFHGDCLEGMASGTALTARHADPASLGETAPVWTAIADYLGQACLVLRLTFGIERIVFGGGVMMAPGLLSKVRTAYGAAMNGYLPDPAGGAPSLIQAAAHGEDAGLQGALTLVQQERHSPR